MRKPPVLWIVIPCYNEQEVLPVTTPIFLQKLRDLMHQKLIDAGSGILFVDDGSRDKTWQIIRTLCDAHENVRGISLSRNRGHQNALLAGLMEAKDACDVTISIDCDGQDDPDAMDEMVRAYLDGCDVVYGVRKTRDTDTFFKRTSAQAFYRLMRWMGVDSVYNHADYRLLSARALNGLAQFHEVNLFLRGMIPLVGFKSTSVYYARHKRFAGKSHYPLGKMLALALDGITSLSTRPIRIVTMLGFFVTIISFCGVIWSLVCHAVGAAVAGWASIVTILCFLGGIQLLGIGVVGEYVGKIYLETKARPRYIIAERTKQQRDDI